MEYCNKCGNVFKEQEVYCTTCGARKEKAKIAERSEENKMKQRKWFTWFRRK